MNKKLKSQLKIAFDAPKPKRKNEFLESINYPKASPFDFVISQVGYIRKRVWIFSLILFIFALLGIHFYENTFKVIWIISSFTPFVALITITEISRSTSFNMAELEMSCKHSFSKVILVRLAVLGSFNFVALSLFILFFMGKTNYSILPLGMYILAPFLLTCILSIFTLNHTYAREGIYICGGISGFISILYMTFTMKYYEFFIISGDRYIVFLSIAFLILLISLIKEIVKFIKRTEELKWNLTLTL